MKKIVFSICLLLVCAVLLTACGKGAGDAFDAEKAFERILSEVKYGAKLEDVSKSAEFAFSGVPEGTEIRFWASEDGKLADAAILFKVKDAADLEKVRTSVEQYIKERRIEAERYSPEEVTKLDGAVTKAAGNYFIVCVTDDLASARDILN